MIFEKLLQLEQRLDAVFGRSATPFGIGCSGGLHGCVYFSGAGERSFGDGFSGRGIGDVEPVRGGGFDPLAIDVVRNFG